MLSEVLGCQEMVRERFRSVNKETEVPDETGYRNKQNKVTVTIGTTGVRVRRRTLEDFNDTKGHVPLKKRFYKWTNNGVKKIQK